MRGGKRATGFSLVEMAVVLVLIGIVMSMGLGTLTAVLEKGAYSETRTKLVQIQTALIGYLRMNGRLPCPDNSDNTTVATGVAAATCNANAADGYGIVPWQTLGLPRDIALDGWGNYFSYRVANGLWARNWTANSAAATDFTINEVVAPANAMTIQQLNPAGTALVTTTTKAVVVLLSHGKNGAGAKTTKVGARLGLTSAGAGETTNATVGTTTFVLRPLVEDAGAFNGWYDDVLVYMQPTDLLQPLLSEASIKSCTAYCSTSVSAVCSVPAQTCLCTAAGVMGTPGGTNPCTGTCGQCTYLNNCVPTGPLPVGATPANCA